MGREKRERGKIRKGKGEEMKDILGKRKGEQERKQEIGKRRREGEKEEKGNGTGKKTGDREEKMRRGKKKRKWAMKTNKSNLAQNCENMKKK